MSRKYKTIILPDHKEERKRPQGEVKTLTFTIKPEEEHIGLNKKFLLRTFGCQGNIADSEKLRGIFKALDFTETDKPEEADLILFNTCAIRKNAEDRVFGEIGRYKPFKETNKNLKLAVCGCMSQEEGVVSEIRQKHPQVDLIFGTHNIQNLPSYLYTIFHDHKKVIEVYSEAGDVVEGVPVVRESDKKAWVDIMHGCDEFCTYCIVPYTRGRERSREPEAIIKEVESLVKQGYIEVNLLGQNVNSYGLDFKDKTYHFSDLLNDLSKTGIERIRFMTSHPKDFDQAAIDCYKNLPNLMPYLHLPVQSGSNEILKKMNRKYTKEQYLDIVRRLKEARPDIAITTDIIVAFPGETEEDFQETLDLCRKAQFEGAFTFIYSPREGTPAATYPNQIPQDIASDRLNRLNEVIAEGYAKGNKRFEGTIQKVLVEGVSDKNPNALCGYTPYSKLVNFEGDKSLIGQMVEVKIIEAFTWHLWGELIK